MLSSFAGLGSRRGWSLAKLLIGKELSVEEVADRLRATLGSGYQIGELPAGQTGLLVRRNAVIRSPVRVGWEQGATVLDVRAGGVGVIFRVVNTLGIARRVREALVEAFPEARPQ
jgi:hypothetical protein